MKRETESQYVDLCCDIDKSKRWESETGYMTGLSEDAGELVDFTVTPSGSTTRQTTGQSAGGGWVDAFKAALPAVAGVIQQREYNKMNLALINKGKPPMSAEQYTNVYQPATRVAVGPTDDAKKLMMYAGIGLLALIGLRAAKVI
jgi:hypothetical protein